MPGAGGNRELGVTVKGYGVPSQDENVLKLDSSNDCTTLWIYWKPTNCTFSKGKFYGIWLSQ